MVSGLRDIRKASAIAEADAPSGSGTEDVVANFVRYCKAYLSDCCSLTPDQAQILVLDPGLGLEMDATKRKWAWSALPPEADPDTFLLAREYDAPEMKRINSVLDQYANEYASREKGIRNYLRSIGHSLG